MSHPTLDEIAALKTKAQTFPTSFYEARKALADAKTRVADIKGEIDEAENETMALVAGETNGGDKPKFTNEQARKAETARRLRADAQHQHHLGALRAAEAARLNAELVLQRIEDEQRSHHRACELTVAEVNLLTAGL